MPTRKTKGGGYRYGKTGKTHYDKGAQQKTGIRAGHDRPDVPRDKEDRVIC